MAWFSKRLPRLLLLALGLAGFLLLSPETLARGPDLCLWRGFFHLSSCPACGSTRALAAFFHGRFADALAFNPNVIVTAPLLLAMLFDDFRRLLGRLRPRPFPPTPGT